MRRRIFARAEWSLMISSPVRLAVVSENGSQSTLRLSDDVKSPELPVFDLPALPPDVVTGQVDVLPAQQRWWRANWDVKVVANTDDRQQDL